MDRCQCGRAFRGCRRAREEPARAGCEQARRCKDCDGNQRVPVGDGEGFAPGRVEGRADGDDLPYRARARIEVVLSSRAQSVPASYLKDQNSHSAFLYSESCASGASRRSIFQLFSLNLGHLKWHAFFGLPVVASDDQYCCTLADRILAVAPKTSIELNTKPISIPWNTPRLSESIRPRGGLRSKL